MAHTSIKSGQIISLDSLDARLIELEGVLAHQTVKISDQINLNHSMIQQLKVANIYKSYETDVIIDETIFEQEK